MVELYFGRGGVPDSAWDKFLADVVTPRFPDGLTAIDGRGQWRNPRTGAIGREQSSVVTIAVERGTLDRTKLGQVTEAYRRMFNQVSVGRLFTEKCGGFD